MAVQVIVSFNADGSFRDAIVYSYGENSGANRYRELLSQEGTSYRTLHRIYS